MSETQAKSETEAPKLLAAYDCDEGRRQLIGQRVEGKVRITDHRPGGRSYLVADEIASMAELEGLVAHYLEHAERLGYAPAQRLPI